MTGTKVSCQAVTEGLGQAKNGQRWGLTSVLLAHESMSLLRRSHLGGAAGRGRVAEPVAYGDDAFHVPDGVDDVEADPGGLRRALDGNDAVLDGDGEPVWVVQEGARD